jgi:hypothetical protein
MTVAFREQRRNYGVLVPVDDVEPHLACGWKLIDDFVEAAAGWPRDAVLLKPPRSNGERAA